MSRFISNKTQRINISEGEWIEVKEGIPFEEYKEIMKKFDKDDDMKNLDMAMPLLKAVLVQWSFKDGDREVACSAENIERLDSNSILEIMQLVMPLYMPEKKS